MCLAIFGGGGPKYKTIEIQSEKFLAVNVMGPSGLINLVDTITGEYMPDIEKDNSS